MQKSSFKLQTITENKIIIKNENKVIEIITKQTKRRNKKKTKLNIGSHN